MVADPIYPIATGLEYEDDFDVLDSFTPKEGPLEKRNFVNLIILFISWLTVEVRNI